MRQGINGSIDVKNRDACKRFTADFKQGPPGARRSPIATAGSPVRAAVDSPVLCDPKAPAFRVSRRSAPAERSRMSMFQRLLVSQRESRPIIHERTRGSWQRVRQL